SADDASAAISLGSNTFNFYGTTYTASQIFVSDNGLITFTSAITTSNNSDLSTSPTQAAIAVVWDDWTTNAATSSAGATNDCVLYQLDAVNNRLIIEWNAIRRVGITSLGDVTFQAILQLNTGSVAGNITL